MKTIVVTTDFTSAATNAVEYAAQLAKLSKARLHILHAYHVPPLPAEAQVMPDMSTLEKDCYIRLENTAEDLNERYGIVSIVKAEMGFAVSTIINYCNKVNANLVVMGMREHSKLSELFIGSTTVSYLKQGNRELLIVPENVKFRAPRKIALASDLMEVEIHSLDLLKEIAEHYNSKILIVNVSEKELVPNYEKSVVGIHLDQYFEELNHIFLFPEGNDPVTGLQDFMEKHPCDWIATIHRKHGFLDRIFGNSISQKMAYSTSVPLLVLPDKTTKD